jgi:hypothetical protein
MNTNSTLARRSPRPRVRAPITTHRSLPQRESALRGFPGDTEFAVNLLGFITATLCL